MQLYAVMDVVMEYAQDQNTVLVTVDGLEPHAHQVGTYFQHKLACSYNNYYIQYRFT